MNTTHQLILSKNQCIEELVAICDEYNAKLEQREKVNERLVKGLVQEVLERE